MNDTITIEYTAAALTGAGFRPVTITAKAERTSAKMARVVAVTAIDGETPRFAMSRTGAARQQYNGNYVAQSQVGARKRLSACRVVEG